jgi:hypothetical protein
MTPIQRNVLIAVVVVILAAVVVYRYGGFGTTASTPEGSVTTPAPAPTK